MNHLILPTEIWHRILLFSQNHYQCALVCKDWTVISLQQLYKDLRLDGYNIYRLKQLLELNADERTIYFNYLALTTRLTIDRDGDMIKFDTLGYLGYNDAKLEQDQFMLFLENLPRIRVLHLARSKYEGYYFQYLREADSHKSLNAIQRFYSTSTFNNFSLCYRYRATITTIKTVSDNVLDLQGLRWSFYEALNHFESLTNLTVVDAQIGDITPLRIQLACPHLVTFKYSTGYKIRDFEAENFFRGVEKSQINSHLKVFQLHVPNLPVYYFNYISNYLVSHLDSLDLQISRYQLLNWSHDVGMENALTFTKNISALKESRVVFQYPYKNMIMENMNAEIITFYELLNAFEGPKHRLCQGGFKFTGNPCYSMYRSTTNLLQFECPLNIKGHFPPMISNIADAYKAALNTSLPDKAFSNIGPKLIDFLNIHVGHGNPKLVFVIIQHTLIHFPNLQACSFALDATSTKIIYIGDTVKELQIQKDRYLSSRCGRQELKVFKSLHLIPSQDTLDLLSTHLPNIQILVCNAKIMYGRWTQKVTEIDLTAFKDLQLFQFDDYNIWAYGTDFIFIQLQVDNGNVAYYYRNCETSVVYEAITVQEIQEYQNDATLKTRILSVKCNSGVKLILLSGNHTVAAEFDNEILLDYINIDTKFL